MPSSMSDKFASLPRVYDVPVGEQQFTTYLTAGIPASADVTIRQHLRLVRTVPVILHIQLLPIFGAPSKEGFRSAHPRHGTLTSPNVGYCTDASFWVTRPSTSR